MNTVVAEQKHVSSLVLSESAIKVHDALVKHGLETPMIDSGLTTEEKYLRLKSAFEEVVSALGLDLTDDSLAETPHRIAKMYVKETFSGLDYALFPKITVIDNKMKVDEMVKVSNISFTSMCEHHFVTIDGFANVAYLPKNKIIGLSKINRIVRFFAQRPQVQERFTQQILVTLQALLETNNVAVRISATHYCVKARGVMDARSSTQTTALGGLFKRSDKARGEFLSD